MKPNSLLVYAAGLYAAALLGGLCRADEPLVIFPPLPVPLKLPPGLVETLPLNKTGSFFGDALRMVDCTDPLDIPQGTCGNQLFGGLALTDSHLAGNITIQFFPPAGNISHFVVSQHVLTGSDALLSAPLGYSFPVKNTRVSDALQLSSGDLDLTTGGVSHLDWRLNFSNTGLSAMVNANPTLAFGALNFPGARGHAYATFKQRADGLLDFYFRGSTFLPSGSIAGGAPFRFPLPFCDREWNCATVLARGTSFHPHLYLNTADPGGDPCGSNCPDIPLNRIQEFTIHSYYSSFGDNFDLDIAELGGTAAGRSHLQGRLQIQFGPQEGDTIPFVITSLVPEALFATPPQSDIAGHGVQPGLIGQQEYLQFPLQKYFLQRVAFVDEPFNFAQGEVDIRTGKVLGQMEYPSFYAQSLADALFRENAPRISTDPFFVVASDTPQNAPQTTYALFERGVNGETLFRFSGEHRRSFTGYKFPYPDLLPGHSWISGPNGKLDLFARLQAGHVAETANAVKSGSRALVSSLGDIFSYRFSIACSGAGAPFSFTYTNGNSGPSGGTFNMQHLAAVNCTNSRNSSARPGDYDTVNFSGFGAWSKDAPGALPRFATVSISLAPDAPYAGIIVFQNPDADQNVILSSANDKPPDSPLP